MPGGPCPAYLLTPPGPGRNHPSVVFYADAGGLRPAMVGMARRLADAGFVVLLPDPYWRHGPYETLVPAEVFKGDVMAILGPLIATSGNARAAEDADIFLQYLDATGLTDGGPVGAVGFCMGGGMAIAAAATVPGRFAAVASFHGGNLATDDAASPHRLAGSLSAEVYLACADQDPFCPPAMVAQMEKALSDAGVRHRIDTYSGASHGWMVPDFPVFDPVAAERGWDTMLALFRQKLGN